VPLDVRSEGPSSCWFEPICERLLGKPQTLLPASDFAFNFSSACTIRHPASEVQLSLEEAFTRMQSIVSSETDDDEDEATFFELSRDSAIPNYDELLNENDFTPNCIRKMLTFAATQLNLVIVVLHYAAENFFTIAPPRLRPGAPIVAFAFNDHENRLFGVAPLVIGLDDTPIEFTALVTPQATSISIRSGGVMPSTITAPQRTDDIQKNFITKVTTCELRVLLAICKQQR
jgi:hypothetical protein